MTYEISFLAKQLPAEAGNRHFAFIGTTGAGKTLALKILMNSVLHHVGKGIDHRAVIYDAKKDMHSILQDLGIDLNLVRTLNPFDDRCVGWDMAADINSPASALELSNILVPQKEESQPFFSDATRDLVGSVILSHIINYPGEWAFRDILLTMRSRGRICEILTRGEAKKYVGGRTLYFDNERSGNSIMATIRTKLNAYEIIAALWETRRDENTGRLYKREKISLKNWVGDRNGSILLFGASESAREAMDIINRVLFKRLTQLVLDQTEDMAPKTGPAGPTRRTWFILDELRMMGNLTSSGIGSLFTQGRSKGACVAITLQDIDGLKAIYGDSETNEILAQCNSKIVLQLSSPGTAKWASELAGKMLKREKDRSESWGTVGHTAANAYMDAKQQARVQISESDKLIERDRVIAGWFLDRPSTNRQNGMHGFYMTPYSEDETLRQGKGFICQSGTIDALLTPKNGRRPALDHNAATLRGDINFYPRRPEDQFLEKWSAEELARKGLMSDEEIEAGETPPAASNGKINIEQDVRKYVKLILEEHFEDQKLKEKTYAD